MRIAFITDSHLSPSSPECVANWRAAAAAVQRLDVDMTVHLGDISLDAQSDAAELPYCAELLAAWPTPLRCVPGNHDVGDGSGDGPLRPDLLADYRRLFGPDRWIVCSGDWQLIGLNAQLMGTGSDEEAEQWSWLEEHAAWSGAATRTALMLHRPVEPPDASEADRRGRYVAAAARDRLLRGPLAASLALVLSGHTHQHLDRRDGPVRHLWVPSSGYIIPDTMQPRAGEKLVGFGVLELDGADARYDLVCPDGMRRHRLDALQAFRPDSH